MEDDDLESSPLFGQIDGAFFGICDADAPALMIECGGGLPPVHVAQRRAEEELGTARFVWLGAVPMARLLAGWAQQLPAHEARNLKAVELGAGCGLCAAALALGLRRPQAEWVCSDERAAAANDSAPCVLATDLELGLGLLRDTVERNALGDIMRVAKLDWFEALEEARVRAEAGSGESAGSGWTEVATSDLVLGADVTWNDTLRPAVLELMAHACKAGAIALLTHEDRGDRSDLERELRVLGSKPGLRLQWRQTIPPECGSTSLLYVLWSAASEHQRLSIEAFQAHIAATANDHGEAQRFVRPAVAEGEADEA